MKTTLKRLFSLLMVLVMLGSMLPAVYADSTPAEEPVNEAIVLTDEDYTIVNDVFAQIDAMEDAPAKKSASRTQITDAAAQIVMASENYVEGSLERNGNSFTWWTDEGIRCIYNPYMREKYDNMQAPADPEPAGIYNAPKATKGGWPSGNQVYLIAPYYGIDDTFTDQYKNEAKAIASAIGDTDGYTLYSGTSVTVDSVADAIENGAVVIFDSHGTTDYDGSYVCDDPDGYEVYDYVSQAKYSYLCLTNKSGLTTADYNAGATYFIDGDGYMCACINGAAIANHMEKNSPSGLLWMAICLGMATDTMCEPMREKGVEVVYGYSQSVTFAGDYCFEETFWDNMTAGKDVATSIAAMKSKWGNWDWSEPIAASYGYSGSGYTLSEARKYRSAFPIVVSDEDTHPGQRDSGTNYGACSEQTVKSTYTLYSQYNVTAQSNNAAYGSVSVSGSTITASPANGYFAQGYTVLSGTASVTQNGNIFSVSAESDCTIQINFAAKTAVTVNFSGANVSGQTGYAGDAMALPTAEAPEGYKFLGWMTAPLSGDTTEKPSYYTDSFIPAGNTTLYALYSYVDAASGGGSGDYVKVTESRDDWSGEYLIVYEAGSRVFDGSRTTLEAVNNYQDVTISDNTISADEADAYKFIIASMNGGYSVQSASGMYISGTSGSNKLNEGTTASANTISIDASGNADIVSNTSHLRYNATSGQDRFRYYKSTSYSSQKAIALYVKDGSAGTTYYTTTLCDHENVTKVVAVAATCTEAGYTAGTQCIDCGSYVTGHEVVAALGHNWSDWDETTAPGCETAGQQTHTCSVCGATETQSVAATGHSYDAGVITTAPTCTANGVKTFTCSACGDTKTESVPATGHTVGEGVVTTAATCTTEGVLTYTCTSCGNTTTEAIPATGHSFADGVCSACGEAEPKVTGYYIAAIRSSGNYFYMTSDLGTASTKRYQAVDSGLTVLPETITNPEDGFVFNLIDNGDGTYSLQAVGVEGDNYLGWTSGNSGTLVTAENAVKATVDISNGIYSIHFAASDAERYLALNGTTNNNYFAWYKSGQKQDLTLIPVGGTTTEPSEPTEPEVTEPDVTEPSDPVTGVEMVTAPSAAVAYKLYLEQTTLGQTLYFAGTVANKDYYLATTEDVNAATDVYLETVDGGYYLYFMDGSTKTYIDMYQSDTYYNLRLSTSPSAVYTYDSTYNTLIAFNGDINCFIGTHSSYNTMSCCKETYLTSNMISHLGLPTGSTVEPDPEEPTEPEITEPEVTEPEATEPEASEPADSVTSLQYIFSDYAAGTQYAQGENHTLDDVVSLTINGAHLNGQIRLYAGSNAVFTSAKVIDSIIVKAGYKAGTLKVYGSTDGETWELIASQATTTTYTNYSFDMPGEYTYVMLESVGAQIRVPEMTINVVEPGAETVCEHLNTTTTTVGATSNTEGSITVTCNDCGETISTESIPYLAGAVKSWGMTLGGELSVNFEIYVHETIRETAQIAVTVAGEAYDIGDIAVGEDGYYTVTIKIAAAQMADTINIQITNSNGKNAGVSKDYTVEQYAEAILADAAQSQYHQIVKAMLNYGGAAQTYFGYNTENLVSTEFGTETPETTDEMVVTDTSADINFYGASLIFRERIAVRFYFTGNVEGKLFTVQGKEVNAMQKDGLYYVEIGDIMPYELGQQYTVTADGISVTYGPLNYIVRMYEKGNDTTKNLMQALYNYYLVALDYVTAE